MPTAEQHITLTLEEQQQANYREGTRMAAAMREAWAAGREPDPEIRPTLRLATGSHGTPAVIDLDGRSYGPDDQIEIALPSVGDAAGASHGVRETWTFGGLIALAAEQAAEHDPVSEFVVNAHKFLGWDDPRS